MIHFKTTDSSRLISGQVVSALPQLRSKSTKNQRGLSFIELTIALLILVIIAAVALPDLSSNDHAKLDIAASEVAEAIRFARLESIRTASPYGVNVNDGNDRVRVYLLVYMDFFGFPIWTPTYDVYHPVDKKLYTLNLKTDVKTSGVDLQSHSILFTDSGTNSDFLGFNSNGNPKKSVGNTDYLLDGIATITLAYSGQTRVISVAPITGRVTVQ